MKKIVLLVLVFALILSAASCGFSIVEKPAETPVRTSAPKETDVPSGSVAPEETAAPAETPAPEEPGEEEPEDTGPDYADYALTGLHVLERGFTDGKIVDEASAAAVISRCSEDIGCTNALEELAPFISCSLDGENYYRMQQCFRGLPVYGRYVVAAASDEGEVLGLTTDARDIPEDLDLTPTVTEEDVRAGVTEHALYTRGVLRDDLEIQPLSEGKLVVYDLDEALGARLAYELLVENEGQYIVIVDAKTGEVLDSAEMMFAGTGYLVDGTEGPIEELGESDKEKYGFDKGETVYVVEDTERNLTLLNYYQSNSIEKKNEEKARQVTSRDKLFGDIAEDLQQDPGKAFHMMNNIGDIHDYYLKNFHFSPPKGRIRLIINDGWSNGNNAYAWKGEIISIGYMLTGQERGILAHEYTHLVQQHYNASNGSALLSATVREGLSDTFACFFTEDWGVSIFNRTADDPTKNGYPDNINDTVDMSLSDRFTLESNYDNFDVSMSYYGSWYSHTYATVISHAAYLMHDSGEFDDAKLELQKLWYKTMILLPYNCNYINLRSCMENVAILSHYSAEQKAAVAKAFDDVGISYDNGGIYRNDFVLTVYDKQGNKYDDFSIEISKWKENGTGKPLEEDQYTITDAVDDADACKYVHLKDGKYVVRITDNGNSRTCVEYSIVVNTNLDTRKVEYMYAQGFGADYTVARGAKLTVLDVNGEELTDYHASVRTDSGFQPITDGVIDLPEKNYYNVLLTHREGDTVYLDGFTLRIREDAPDALTCQTRFTKAPAPQEPPEKEPPEGDPDPALAEAEAGIQGLWNTRNRLGLYSFEDGKVTFYHLCHPGDDPADRVYVKGETAEYTIEPLSEEIGKGFRITWDDQTGEYRLLDGSPYEMILYGMNDQGELQPAGFGYSDLIRFTEYSAEDIIPVVDAAAAPISEECAYTGTVRSYIAEYGELEFKSDGSGSYYLGVFLVKLIDFDRDGTEELVVGYATENAEGYCPQPKLDVWTLEEGEPVLVYEHARIGHGDIGSHCAHIEWDGRTCLVTGYSGFETALTLRAFENGHFEEILTVEMEYGDEEYRWTVNGEAVSEEEGAEISRRINAGSEKYNGYIGSPSHGAKPKAQILAELEYGYKVLGLREEIMAWYGF